MKREWKYRTCIEDGCDEPTFSPAPSRCLKHRKEHAENIVRECTICGKKDHHMRRGLCSKHYQYLYMRNFSEEEYQRLIDANS